MSHWGNSNKKDTGIEFFKSRIEGLNLSPEEESRVKNLFQNYSDGINQEHKPDCSAEEFKQFAFFPGVVFVIDSNFHVVYQNRSFNNLHLVSAKGFGGYFETGTLNMIHNSLEEVKENNRQVNIVIRDVEGSVYESRICRYDSTRGLSLLFLYKQKKVEAVVSENTGKPGNEITSLLKENDSPVSLYLLENDRLVILNNKAGVKGDGAFKEEAVLTTSFERKLLKALESQEVMFEDDDDEPKEKAKRRVIIPLSRKVVCVALLRVKELDDSITVSEIVEKYRLIANSLTDLFFILDKDLSFSFIAPSIEPALDYKYSELVGKGFDILVPKWSGNTLRKKLDSIKDTGMRVTTPHKFAIQLSGKYGSLKWYELQISMIYNEQNELQGYNGICRDISERLKYEEALMQAKQKAEESDNLKSTFLANMSHEIRTPLNGIIGFATMINNRSLSEEKREKYARYIVSGSKQLLTLISDIIDISKIEAGQLSVVYSLVDLNKLLNELYATIELERNRLNKADVKLEIEVGEPELKIVTDEIRLKQVLINLLSNALKFTHKGKIEMGYETQGNDIVRFFVRDSGEGIPENIQKAVFERFRQGNVDKQEKISGTGLGLAISKGIIELLGGEIGVKSKEKEGSEFYFTLSANNKNNREKEERYQALV